MCITKCKLCGWNHYAIELHENDDGNTFYICPMNKEEVYIEEENE